MADAPLVLASASPRRLELLRLAGLDPAVRFAPVDESLRPGEAPQAYVARVAAAKAQACPAAGAAVVLAADTTVVADGAVLGKPADLDDARRILQRLSGRDHEVLTGVAVLDADRALSEEVVVTTVRFTELTDDMLSRYVATGEPLDKAGAYGIQGRAAALVERIDGSYTNVVGLPLVETLRLLARAGVTP